MNNITSPSEKLVNLLVKKEYIVNKEITKLDILLWINLQYNIWVEIQTTNGFGNYVYSISSWYFRDKIKGEGNRKNYWETNDKQGYLNNLSKVYSCPMEALDAALCEILEKVK